MSGPLDGIHVLDWTQFQLGPVATAMLADLGATVIHIEKRATGDPGRHLMRSATIGTSDLPHGRTAYFEVNNRGKRSIAVDLDKKQGREIIYRLVKNSDVFVHNFRPGIAEKMGLDYETLLKYNPKIIYAAASGFGPRGPEAGEPSLDLVALARMGIMMRCGEPGAPPAKILGGIGDQMGAIMTFAGVLAALVARERLGVGQKVDVSHLGSLMALQGLAIGQHLLLGEEKQAPGREKAGNPLWNTYKCKDGNWIVLSEVETLKKWPLLCKALGITELIKDPRYENAYKRMKNSAGLIAVMDRIFLTRTAAEWIDILKKTGDIICAPVHTLSDLPDDPQVLANDYIVQCDHETLGPVKVLGMPIQLSKTPGKIKSEAPELGQDTEQVLVEIGGYNREEIEKLKEDEVI